MEALLHAMPMFRVLRTKPLEESTRIPLLAHWDSLIAHEDSLVAYKDIVAAHEDHPPAALQDNSPHAVSPCVVLTAPGAA